LCFSRQHIQGIGRKPRIEGLLRGLPVLGPVVICRCEHSVFVFVFVFVLVLVLLFVFVFVLPWWQKVALRVLFPRNVTVSMLSLPIHELVFIFVLSRAAE
jgi:hypothetical protein